MGLFEHSPAYLCDNRTFLVVVHDIAPRFLRPLLLIGSELRQLVGGSSAGAVVPCWHGGERSDHHPALVEYIHATFGEILLHGYHHAAPQPRGLVAQLTDGANEFSRLRPAEAARRLHEGRAFLEAGLARRVRGFVPPAWQPGPVTPALLASCGLGYGLGFWRLSLPGEIWHPLAVWSWDGGRVAASGLAGEALGWLRLALRPDAIPCVVLHPRDVARGYLVRALRLIDQLLTAGWRPALPAASLPDLETGTPMV